MTELLPPWAVTFAVFYAGASAVATLLIQFMPTPQEIAWKPYVIFYNTVQRLSVHRPAWNKSNGKPPEA